MNKHAWKKIALELLTVENQWQQTRKQSMRELQALLLIPIELVRQVALSLLSIAAGSLEKSQKLWSRFK